MRVKKEFLSFSSNGMEWKDLGLNSGSTAHQLDDLGQVNLSIKYLILPPLQEIGGLEKMENIKGHWPGQGQIISCSPAGASLLCCECAGVRPGDHMCHG